MMKNRKIITLLVILVFCVSSLNVNIYAKGDSGGGNSSQPSLDITRFQSKEATEYTWEMDAEFSDWGATIVGDDETEINLANDESQLTLIAKRTRIKDQIQIIIEAELSLVDFIALYGDVGYKGEDGKFVTLNTTEITKYTRDSTGKLSFMFYCDDLEREFFGEVTYFTLRASYSDSRGSVQEVKDTRTIEMEEHEALGYTQIETDLDVVVNGDVDFLTDTSLTDTTADDSDNMMLIQLDAATFPVEDEENNDIFVLNETLKLTTDAAMLNQTQLSEDIVHFWAHQFSENNDLYSRRDTVLADCIAIFPLEDVVKSTEALLTALTVKPDGKDDILVDFEDGVAEIIDEVETGNLLFDVTLDADDDIFEGSAVVNEDDSVDVTLPNPMISFVTLDSEATVEIDYASDDNRTTTVVVTSESGLVTQNYVINYNYDDSLKDAQITELGFTDVSKFIDIYTEAGGVNPLLDPESGDFDPSIRYYEFLFPLQAEDMTDDQITAFGESLEFPLPDEFVITTSEGATYEIVESHLLNVKSGDVLDIYPGEIQIIVTAEDRTTTKTYTLFFTYEGEGTHGGDDQSQGDKNDPSLESLYLDGVELEDFKPRTLEYTIPIPTNNIPVISYTTKTVEAIVVIDDDDIIAVDADGDGFADPNDDDGTIVVPSVLVDGKATIYIKVTSPFDEFNTNVYILNFISAGTDVTLSSLTVVDADGIDLLEDFSSGVHDYTIDLPDRILPTINAVANDENALVSINTPSLISTDVEAVITVIAEDGLLAEVYTVKFIVADAVTLLGTFLSVEDDFVLEKSSTKVDFWVAEPILSPSMNIYEVTDATKDISEQKLVVKIGAKDLKMPNKGNGKHNTTSLTTTSGGIYKYSMKGRNLPMLEEGKDYAVAILDGDKIIDFGSGKAVLNFTVGDNLLDTVKKRNQTLNLTN